MSPGSEFLDWLERRIGERTPAAVVRFGDGEASTLEASRDVGSMEIATRRLGRESGLRFPPDTVLEIGRAVARALEEADALGFHFSSGDQPMNRLTSLYLERLAAGGKPALLSSPHLHHAILDRLPGLLAGRRVSAISCRDVKPVLEGEWGLDDVVVYQVPSQSSARDLDGAYEAVMHDIPIWPDRIAELRSELTVRERGEVFLVGAGMFGKDLCIDIREKGGLAIDLGSALDRIVGKVARGPARYVRLLHLQGMSPAEIVGHLEDRGRAEVDPEKIQRITEKSPYLVSNPHDPSTLLRVEKMAVDPEASRARLEEELGSTQKEARRLGRRLETLDRERAARVALIEALETEVARAAGSRSFRYGHGTMRHISNWLLRRPARQSGLDAAAGLLEEARRDLAKQGPRSGAARQRSPAEPTRPLEDRPRPTRKPFAAERARLATETEETLRKSFEARYEAIFGPSGEAAIDPVDLSGPLPRDRRGMLLGCAADSEPAHPGVDVVVCVRDASEEVRTCLWSLLHSATRPFHLIVVDDGSGPETAAMLETLAEREPEIELIRNEGPEHGYTRAANIGLRASTGAHVVLLNSDTIVSPFWLERIVACAESDSRIGVVGPLSNAATHQSLPAVTKDGRWAVNELPAWLTVDSMALLVAELSGRERPRVPFVNGFCYAIGREAIERVGLFDEDLFGSGYCEENDFSIRLRDAGLSLALADDAYVFHSKSRSYTSAGRDDVAQRNYKLFLEKHGEERVRNLLAELEDIGELGDLREASAAATATEEATVEAFRAANPDPLEVLFVLHGMPERSGGGVHSVYQETKGLRRLGVPARIAIAADATERARDSYADADDLFVPFDGEGELAQRAANADVVVATHYTTVAMVGRLHARYGGFMPAYYAQDYEPFFADAGSAQLIDAVDSYTAIPGQCVFAKTHWLRNLIGQLHGVEVAKVEPSLDRELFSTEGRKKRADGPVRIAAMIRPRTPRRQPVLTLDALGDLAAKFGRDVEVTTFGCPVESVKALGRRLHGPHLGLLTREQVADLLKRSDVFLDASTYQAFGRTAIEAMACGCTVVAPRIGGAAEFVEDERNGLLADTLQPLSVSRALDRLIKDADLLDELQAGAVAEAGKHSILRAALSEYALFARALA
jgi:GT2 family glycosyltransferase/glycosyltransferase involved in cell wall biosynthesis